MGGSFQIAMLVHQAGYVLTPSHQFRLPSSSNHEFRQETKTFPVPPSCDTSMSWLLKHSMSLFAFTTASVLISVCLKMLAKPLNPMVLLIIIPIFNGYFIGNINPTFSDKPISVCNGLQWHGLLSTQQGPKPAVSPARSYHGGGKINHKTYVEMSFQAMLGLHL